MATSDLDPGQAARDDADVGQTAHCSTGRCRHAASGEAGRLLGLDDRPRASCSDVIAAAVAELLIQAPRGELELARYAHAGWQAQCAARAGERPTMTGRRCTLRSRSTSGGAGDAVRVAAGAGRQAGARDASPGARGRAAGVLVPTDVGDLAGHGGQQTARF